MNFKKGNYYGLFILLNIILFIISFWAIKTNVFHKLDEAFYNFTQTSPIFKKETNQKNQKIAIVGIDNDFFTKEGITTSTFHRGYYAQAIKKLQEAGVTTIAIDVVFNDLKYKDIEESFLKNIDEAISISLKQYDFISEEVKLQINKEIQKKILRNLEQIDITQKREFIVLKKSINAILLSVLEPYDDINISNMKDNINKNIEEKIKIFSNEKYMRNYFYSESLNFFDDSFIKEMKENIVIGALADNDQVEYPPEKFLTKGSDIGHVISHDNIYGVTMGVVPFYQDEKGTKVNSLGIQAFINYRKQIEIKENQIPIHNNDIISHIENPNSLLESKKLILQIPNNLPIEIPLSNIGDNTNNTTTPIMITPVFIKSKKDIKYYYSLYDILHTDSDILAQTLEGKVVFIGATDQAFKDIKLTIVGNIPGVYMHANNFIAMNSNQYVTSINNTQTLLIIYAFLIIGMLFILSFHTELASFVIFAIFIGVIVIVGATIYKKYGIWFPVGSFLAIIIIKFIFDIFYALVINLKNKEFVTNFFNRYVGKNVLQKKYTTGSKDAESKNLGIFFSDIASFTNISEKLTATEVVRFLNIYLTECSGYITQNNGYIDKYIGDAIMAFWEDGKHTDSLLISAILITENHKRINKIIKGALEKDLNISTRIGLHYGEGIVGDIGDKNSKINYTIIGDNVNLGARLEGINKFYGTTICMSESTVDRIAKKERFAYRLIDQITVKGKEKAVKIYELITKLDNIDPLMREYIKQFESALEFYFTGNFAKAREEFLKIQVFSIGQDDPVLKLFIKRCADLIVSPPENWTGIWKYDKKG